MEIETRATREVTHTSRLRAPPAARPARREPAGLDDDALDAARQRRRRRQPRPDLCARRARTTRSTTSPSGVVQAKKLRGREHGEAKWWTRCAGRTMVGWRYTGPFDELPAWQRAGVEHRSHRRGTRSAPRKAPASSTSRPAAARKTSRSARSIRPAGPRAARRERRLHRGLRLADRAARRRRRARRSSTTCRRRAASTRRESVPATATRTAGAARPSCLPPGRRVVHRDGRAAPR